MTTKKGPKKGPKYATLKALSAALRTKKEKAAYCCTAEEPLECYSTRAAAEATYTGDVGEELEKGAVFLFRFSDDDAVPELLDALGIKAV